MYTSTKDWYTNETAETQSAKKFAMQALCNSSVRHILPVIHEPVMSQIGDIMEEFFTPKMPSMFAGGVTGRPVRIKGWPTKQLTDEDINNIAIDTRVAFGVRTSYIYAIDIDIDDQDAADEVTAYLRAAMPEAPVRIRINLDGTISPRKVFLFKNFLEPIDVNYKALPYGRIAMTKESNGAIECLANRFVVLSGKHFNKNKELDSFYEFENKFPTITDIPKVNNHRLVEMFNALAKTLNSSAKWVGQSNNIGYSTNALRRDGAVQQAFLEDNGLILSQENNKIFVKCPWSETHTSPYSAKEAMFVPATISPSNNAVFKCLHAHCVDKTADDYLNAVSFLDFIEPVEQTPSEVKKELAIAIASVVNLSVSDENFDASLDRLKNNKLRASLTNIVSVLTAGTGKSNFLANDPFLGQVVIKPLVTQDWRPIKDADLVHLKLGLTKGLICPNANSFEDATNNQSFLKYCFVEPQIAIIREALLHICDTTIRDSGVLWINSLEWDNVDRRETFITEGLKCDISPFAIAITDYIFTALAGRLSTPGIKTDMVPVFISKQGMRKSTFVQELAPFPEWFASSDLAVKDNDLARLSRGKCVIELPELAGLRSKEAEAIKAWLSTSEDSWIVKYSEYATSFKRRWVAFGTTNDNRLFYDHTGNRRWLPIQVGTNGQLGTDWLIENRNQIWAQGHQLFLKSGIMFAEAQKLAEIEVKKYEVKDVYEPVIREFVSDLVELPDEYTVATQCLSMPRASLTTQVAGRIGRILTKLALERNKK